MSFDQAVRSVLQQYVGFSGRARRSEYWYWALAVLLLDIVVSLVDAAVGSSVIATVVSLALLLPNLGVAFRRLHDSGRSAWWLLIALTGVGLLVLLVFFVMDGTVGENRYGPDPKGRQIYPAY